MTIIDENAALKLSKTYNFKWRHKMANKEFEDICSLDDLGGTFFVPPETLGLPQVTYNVR